MEKARLRRGGCSNRFNVLITYVSAHRLRASRIPGQRGLDRCKPLIDCLILGPLQFVPYEIIFLYDQF